MTLDLRNYLTATAVVLAALTAACGGDDDGNGPNPDPGEAVITTVTASRTLFSDTTYTLSGFVKVQSGAVLTIQPGTKLIGDTTVAGSSLWILRGARIEANGTAAEPIIFTSARSAGNRRPGDWGGIIIVGNGIINRTGASILTEGVGAGQAENYAGGNNNADNSGTLRYVRIEFAGYDVSGGTGGQELNSLSMYAVGSGTRVEYVQTLAGLDDSFEWWGGAVDGRYLVSYESGDDHFDWTEGYQGRNQFLIGFQSTRLDPAPNPGIQATDPRGIEADGCDPLPGSGCTVSATEASQPFSRPVIGNLTLIGPGTTVAGFPADGNGVVFRRGTGGMIDRAIIARWPGLGLNGRDAWTDSLRLRDSLSLTNLVLAENAAGNYDVDAARFFQEVKFVGANHRTAATAASLFVGLTAPNFNWSPAAGTAAATGCDAFTPPKLAARVAGYPYSGGWTTTTYCGAAEPGGSQWWTGWTNYATN